MSIPNTELFGEKIDRVETIDSDLDRVNISNNHIGKSSQS